MEKQIFQFTNYDVPVEIAGQEFILNCSTDTGDYLKEVSADLRELAEKIAAKEKTREDILDYGCGVIDHLLGAGAAEKILGTRKNKVSDVMDVCTFLAEVANKFRAERQKAQGNRAQRRAAAKK